MTQLQGSFPQTRCTRRKAIQLLSTAAGSSFLLAATGCKHEAPKKKQVVAEPTLDCSTNPSVFCSCSPASWPTKYELDKPGIYPYFALWLMLTTEEWDSCLNQAQWQQVQKDFTSPQANLRYFDNLYQVTHKTQVVGNAPPPSEMFAHLRWLWLTFRVNRLKLQDSYHPGYTTARQIAWRFQQSLPPASLSVSCKSGAAATATAPMGPVAYWLMLITSDWSSCVKKVNNWNSRLAADLKMDPTDLQYLFDISEDTKPASRDGKTKLPFTNKDVFVKARDQWVNFIDNVLDPGTYHNKPCSGPTSLLQIAAGGK